MGQELWKIFDNVNSWLQYAERKNAYILTFIGLQLTLMKISRFQTNLLLILSMISLFITFLLCVISFFPETKITGWVYWLARSCSKKENHDNLLFYGHIAKYSINDYIESMEKYLNIAIKQNKYLGDLCSQIVMNSGIANKKFNIFKFSFFFLLIGQFFFIVYLCS